MKLNSRIAALAGAFALVAAATHTPSASAHGVGFAVTVGGPGYGFTAGNYGAPHGSYSSGYYGAYYAPARVVAAPPVPYYRPYRAHYAPVVVPAPYPVARPYGYAGAWGYRPQGHAVHVRGGHVHRPY